MPEIIYNAGNCQDFFHHKIVEYKSYLLWVKRQLSERYPHHIIEISTENRYEQVETDDEERRDEIVDFCSKLLEQYDRTMPRRERLAEPVPRFATMLDACYYLIKHGGWPDIVGDDNIDDYIDYVYTHGDGYASIMDLTTRFIKDRLRQR